MSEMKQTHLDVLFPAKRQRVERQDITDVAVPRPLSVTRGTVCVAKFVPNSNPPAMPGFTTIVIHTSAKPFGGSLSPYQLRDEWGCLLENIWQFAKVYPGVAGQRTAIHAMQPDNIVWEHKPEIHVDGDGRILPDYWAWRQAGMRNPLAVRYPNGYDGRRSVLYSLWPKNRDKWRSTDVADYDKLDYIEARKRIYYGEYRRLAPRVRDFQVMRQRLRAGENLLLCEVDGPAYAPTWPLNEITRSRPGMTITAGHLRALIEDRRHPFGHGYTLAALLLDIDFLADGQ